MYWTEYDIEKKIFDNFVISLIDKDRDLSDL